MAKRPSLTESMKAVQRAPVVREEPPVPAALPAERQAKADRPAGQGYFAATRQGMKRVTFPASPDEHRRLKRLSADTGRPIEALMREALADLFAKLG